MLLMMKIPLNKRNMYFNSRRLTAAERVHRHGAAAVSRRLLYIFFSRYKPRGMPALIIFLALSFAARRLSADDGPDPIFEKPAPITMAELAKKKITGVEAVEVNDYTPGRYQGELKPSPPHADLNPKKAVIIVWENNRQRFVFSHEASYCPWLELPNGAAMCNQFFESNRGWAELMNNSGRRERNSFVDILRSGPGYAWVRWTYFCVNQEDDSKPGLRGTEDYIAYPNGLILRRFTYRSMMPDKIDGYSCQPIDFFSLIPAGVDWETLFPHDPQHGDYHVASALDVYSDRRYDVFWSDPGPGPREPGSGKPRRNGDAELLKQISHSKGYALVMPFKEGYLFSAVGQSTGIAPDQGQIGDNSYKDNAGCGWISWELDHWPIGWNNSQGHTRQPGSPYPYCICQLSHYLTPRHLDAYDPDYIRLTSDMEHNKWTERHVFYQLLGVGKDFESIRRIGRQWLDKGKKCAEAKSIADLQ
jgi:hypothetical protein